MIIGMQPQSIDEINTEHLTIFFKRGFYEVKIILFRSACVCCG